MVRKSQTGFIRILAFLIMICLLSGSSFVNSFADEEKGSIKIEYPVEGSTFYLYRVGSYDDGIVLDEPYNSYQVDLSSEEAASTLASYIIADSIATEFYTEVTEDLYAEFGELSKGVYLLIGDDGEADGIRYSSSPVFAILPAADQDGKEYMDLEIKGKYEENEIPESTSLSVLKIWEDNQSADRPKSVSVNLLKDGEIYETVTLDDSNNWEKNWPELDGESVWTVNEANVPDSYVVSVTRDQNEFVITNKAETPKTPDKPGGKLPKTGQLWWPVGWLAALGLFFILIGLIRRNRNLE